MAKRRKYEDWETVDSKIRNVLRRLWMWSKERTYVLKANDRRCAECGRKNSKAKGKECKVEVHHINGINWKKIFQVLREELFVSPDKLIPLCVECHDKKHAKEEKK